MIIKEMTASFGCLERSTLTLSDGLNVIHAPNESGKSTWCAFIRAMLYGIPTRDRDKKGYLAEKNRYQPWSGTPMEGEMTLEWQGRDITLRRFTKGTAPFGGFSAVYTDTQQPVPDLTAQNCGEVLLGVGREVWERSAFIGSAPTLAIDGTPELERRIAALFSSGEEDVSFSQAEAKLREWQRRRQHNRSGLIPKLEESLTALDTTLAKLSDAHSRFSRAQGDISCLEAEQIRLESEQHIHKRLAARDLNHRYASALQEHAACADKITRTEAQMAALPSDEALLQARQKLGRLDALREETLRQNALCSAAAETLDQARQDCPDHPLLNLTPSRLDDLCHQVQRQRRNAILLTVLSALVPVAALGAGLLVLLTKALPPAAILGGMIAVCAGGMAPLLLSADKCRRTARNLLAQYGASSAQALSALWQERQALRTRLEQAETRLAHSREAHRQALARQQALEGDLAGFVSGFAPEAKEQDRWAAAIDNALALGSSLRRLHGELAQIQHRCDDLKAQGAREADTLELLHQPENTPEQTAQLLARVQQDLSAARSALALAQGEMLSLGDRAELEARRDRLLAQLERRRLEYNALSAALDALRRANEALQARFAPELNHRAGEILRVLTNGRYQALTLDRDFDASARITDSLLPRSALSLSRGTVDQLYLAVRLAVCQLCLNEQEPSPLVLDDALLTFDDGRMALALEYLSGLDQQVLLFSCQRRESTLGTGNILCLHS